MNHLFPNNPSAQPNWVDGTDLKSCRSFSAGGAGSIKGTVFRLHSYSFANISDSNAKGEMADFTDSNGDVETGVHETKCHDLGEDHGGDNLHGHHNLDSHLDLEEKSNNDKRIFALLTMAIRCIGNLTGIVVLIYELITNYLY